MSEILGRVGYNGVAVEEPLDDSAPAVVKAYLVHDQVARIRVRRVRDALGHLQAFGLGPIGDLTVREIQEEAWLETWKASFKPIRIGAFLVRPTWSDVDPGDAVVGLPNRQADRSARACRGGRLPRPRGGRRPRASRGADPPERRELDYVRQTAASVESAKEVKIFGLSDFLIGRYRQLSANLFAANRELAVRRSRR